MTQGKSGGYYVFLVPVAAELDLKKAAAAAGEKAIAMIKARELLPLTGYVHGGCSPIGMKKRFPTFVDETAQLFDSIHFSGGKVGCQIRMNPDDLARLVPSNTPTSPCKLQLSGGAGARILIRSNSPRLVKQPTGCFSRCGTRSVRTPRVSAVLGGRCGILADMNIASVIVDIPTQALDTPIPTRFPTRCSSGKGASGRGGLRRARDARRPQGRGLHRGPGRGRSLPG
ncbi:MAG: YbaK/EbsC family protein [Adlercreutzia equolifaciens]